MSKRLRSIATAVATAVGIGLAPVEGVAVTDNDIVGTWEWMSVDNIASDGTRTQPFGPKPSGYLSFGSGGRFLWLITRPGCAKFASGRRDQGTAEENKATVQGSLAYCGTYSVNNETLILKIEASTYPNEEGAEQKRSFVLRGDELTWKNPTVSTGAAGIARLRRVH